MKKMCVVFSLMLMLLGLLVTQACAAEIVPLYDDSDKAPATLVFNGNTASCVGKIRPDSGQSASITMKLQQRKSGGSWTTIATWTGSSSSGRTASLSKTKTVESGCDYRVYVKGTVKDSSGKVVESPSKYSAVKSI